LSAFLKIPSSAAWLSAVLEDFDAFLPDHAANERKASAMAMSMVAHYPDRGALLTAMIDLAVEELNHFRQVVRLLGSRGLQLQPDEKDPYVNQLRSKVRRGREEYLLDRLLCAAVIEGRGAERFALIATGVDAPDLKAMYAALAASEADHHARFVSLAHSYFPAATVDARLDDWLEAERDVLHQLEIRPRLH
jgi:tRNA 2-(methylsulfanyl)-N6-isopentenyladenosine37 hydroxylase